ncbi:hypothetical protein LSH36_380g01074 [Paralvinella palmiformis]|uniref:Uncharacterized protein n=1 Tax=Paralvinella palmiformis TaxID=53620 RepID=A0AAD9JDU6_9ANNE|nr:hypothetical protein LSH36_380g01074 [Paralvinella palmiformis]
MTDKTDKHIQFEIREEEAALKSLLSLIVQVTLELQDKLRLMFLPTAERCHYIFTMRDISNIFSNLIEQDSGMVTAGNLLGSQGNRSMDDNSDLYNPVYNVPDVKVLLEHGVEEYNKTHPRIKLALYRTVIEQVCRLARVISSPHEVAHCVLVSEGCPGRTPIIVNLAAHLCGFSVFKINSSPRGSSTDYKLGVFKADIVAAYTRAGVKGEKVLFLLEDDELSEEDFLVFLSEFIVSGSISHLFSQEEQTTIINSIRTEVTQAGLSYTRDVAWEFFLR